MRTTEPSKRYIASPVTIRNRSLINAVHVKLFYASSRIGAIAGNGRPCAYQTTGHPHHKHYIGRCRKDSIAQFRSSELRQLSPVNFHPNFIFNCLAWQVYVPDNFPGPVLTAAAGFCNCLVQPLLWPAILTGRGIF